MSGPAFSSRVSEDLSVSASFVKRRRSDGPLTLVEISACRAVGIDLGYDPIQHGLVPLNCQDDILADLSDAETCFGDAVRQVAFRRWHVDDAALLAEFLSNPRIWTYLPDRYPGVLTREQAIDLIRLSNDAEHHDVYAAEVAGRVVGQARLLFDLADTDRRAAEISYWLAEPFWKRGVGSRLITAFTAQSFETWRSLDVIFARVHRANVASARVLLKAGYAADAADEASDWRVFRKRR